MSFKGEKTRSIRIMMGIALITVVTMLIILTGGKAVNAEGASLSEGFKIYCIPDVNISDYSSNNPIPETKKAYLVGGDSVSTVNGLSWDAETNTLTFSGYSGGPVYVGDPNAKTLNNINIVVNKNNNIGSLKNSNSDSVNATLALVNVDAKMTGSGMLTVYNEYSNGYGYCFDTRGNLTIGEAGGSGPNLFLYSGYDTVSVNSEWRFDSTTGAEFNMGGNLTINSGNMMVQMEPATKGGNTYLTNNSAIFADKNIDITGGAFMIVLSWTDKETEKKPYGIFAAGSSISAANANIMVSVDYRAGEVPLFYVPKGTNDDSNNTDKISEVESLNKTVTYDISDVKANLTPSDYEYEGADKTYEPKVEIPGLIEGTDFIVTDYNNNKAPGKANLLIEGRVFHYNRIPGRFTEL